MSELKKCMDALEAIGKSFVKKSATYESPKVLRARAITKASQTPEGAILARRIMQLQRQASLMPIAKAYGMEAEEDEDELRSELRQLQNREKEITAKLRTLHLGGR